MYFSNDVNWLLFYFEDFNCMCNWMVKNTSNYYTSNLYLFSTMRWHKCFKSFLVEDKNQSIPWLLINWQCKELLPPGVGVTKPIFSVPLFSQIFRMMKTVVTWMISSSYLAGVTAAPAETPGKYEHDWKYLTYTFAKSQFPVTEKLTNGALVTPTPGQQQLWLI